MPKIKVQLELELDSPIEFKSTFPLKSSQFILFSERGIKFKFFFNEKSTWWASQSSLDDLEKYSKIRAHRIFIEVTSSISENTAKIITNRDELPNQDSTEYETLGETIQNVSLDYANRIIRYARNELNQYWLEEIKSYVSYSNQFFFNSKAKCIINNETYNFLPAKRGAIIKVTVRNNKRSITKNNWMKLKKSVLDNSRISLVHTLIANAYSFQMKGYRKNSIIEAVIALEMSIRKLTDIRLEKLPKYLRNRINVNNIKSLMKNSGLRGSIDLIIPIIFTRTQVSDSDLHYCRMAIDVRNNIIHNGKRDVEEKEIISMLNAIEKVCLTSEKLINSRFVEN